MQLHADRSGPLTYRTYDGRRKARFLDILSLFNRINNSHLRIAELAALRREQTFERMRCRQVSQLERFSGTMMRHCTLHLVGEEVTSALGLVPIVYGACWVEAGMHRVESVETGYRIRRGTRTTLTLSIT